jgi:hypothetical protein
MKKTRRTVGQPNDTLSFVTLETVIGKPGEQGEAWKARSTAHGTLKFAVKIGRKPLDSSARRNDYEEFQKEFRTLASLNHPNIVKVFDCGVFKKKRKQYLFQDQAANRGVVEKVFFESGSDLRCLSQIEEFAKRRAEKGPVQNAMVHLACVVSGRKRALYKAVVQRDHTQDRITDYGEHMYASQRAKASEICELLKKEGMWGPEYDTFGEHNVLIDCRADKWPDFDKIKIINTLGEESPLAQVAPTVKELGQSFDKQACRIRVFVNVGALKPEYRDKIGRRRVEQAIASGLE